MIIPYGRHDISEEDIEAVVDVLRSNFLTQGPAVPKFEESVSHYCGAQYAIAVNSATSALHIACLALGVGQNDIVWTSPITFVASANCALYCGARVDFVDIDPRTYNLSISCLEEKLEKAAQEGKLPKVLIAVHFSGQSCDMQSIFILSKKYNFRIIEDASHAIGAKYQNTSVGSCNYSDITIFSFHPVKIITSGEGGMAITNDLVLANTMRLIRAHGITNSDIGDTPSGEIWNYQQIHLGFNYRMTDIQAALGYNQMNRLDQFVSRRHDLAAFYDLALIDLDIITPWQHPDSYSSYHLYVIGLNSNDKKTIQRDVYDYLRNSGVQANLHYIPVYLQPFYKKLGFTRGHCPEAERYYSRTLSIPMYSGLTVDQQSRVIKSLRDALER